MLTTAPQPLRALFVEDDEDDYVLACGLLEQFQSGRVVPTRAASFEAGVAAMQQETFHVCLIDYRLGARDGLDFLDEAALRGWNTPIIVLTGLNDPAVDRAAIAGGAADYLIKDGLDGPRLERAIAHALERARNLAARRESERLFHGVFEGALDTMLVVDDDGRVADVNPTGCDLVGRARGAIVGRTLAAFARSPAEITGGILRVPQGDELEILRADGAIRVVEARSVRSIVPGRHLVMLHDVTERREMQARLALADRMISIGTLAAGVTHEINNPLASVYANLDFLAREVERVTSALPQGARTLFDDVVTDMRAGIDRIRAIVRDVKSFSRPDEERLGPVDLSKVIDSAITLAWNDIRHRARIVRNYGETPPARANEGRLGQVILNLLVNAAQAIPPGAADANEISVTTRMRADRRVDVEVRDSGAGIPAAHLGRIFEPFFTTKPIGVGTGLGLAVCQNIVMTFGGLLEVESVEGRGALFRVTLPASVDEAAPPRVVTAPPPIGRRGRILVIDDDPAVGVAIRRSLVSEHEVDLVDSARVALDRITGDASFDLIFCDLMMPVMTGVDFLLALRARWPRLADKVVFLTGGSLSSSAGALLEELPNLCLEKPFDPPRLRALVRERLAHP